MTRAGSKYISLSIFHFTIIEEYTNKQIFNEGLKYTPQRNTLIDILVYIFDL